MAKGKGGFLGQDGLNAPDSPTGVSGTAGDAQVTVSWTAPSDVGGSAITGYSVQSSNGDGTYYSSYDLSSASYDNIDSASLSSQIGQGQGIFFKSDGLKMYASDQSNAYQYSLSTAWDLSTISYDSKSLSLSSASDPNNIFFKSDGTKFYVVSKNDSYILEYDVSTAWDISTGSSGYSRRYLVSGQMSNPTGIFFKPDGTKMYVLSNSSDTVYQYSLSTAWNVTSASYDSKSFSVSTQAPNPRSIQLNDDGTKLFGVGWSNDTVYEYELSTAYDISTASYSNYSLNVSSQDGFPYSMTFKSDGIKLYVFGATSDKVHQYTTGLPSGTYPTASPVTVTGLTNGTSYTFNVWAINAFGWSSPSDASGSVTPLDFGDRGLFGGGNGGSTLNVIDFVAISTTGNATDFGDLSLAREAISSFASSTRGVWAGGYGGGNSNVIDYVTIASTGNATDFGDLLAGNQYLSGLSNSTRGISAGGYTTTYVNVIQYVTIASAGNATDFGDLLETKTGLAPCASPTRGIFAGGGDTKTNVIQYITIASTGNATDFGDLPLATSYAGGCSSSTIGVFGGGSNTTLRSNVINTVTIASTGNATDFGDLTVGRYELTACSNSTRGVFGGGNTITNTMDYVVIASAGNATDFGDLTVARQGLAACSGSHGGLS